MISIVQLDGSKEFAGLIKRRFGSAFASTGNEQMVAVGNPAEWAVSTAAEWPMDDALEMELTESPEGFALRKLAEGRWGVASASRLGQLFGIFRLRDQLAVGDEPAVTPTVEKPAFPLRMFAGHVVEDREVDRMFFESLRSGMNLFVLAPMDYSLYTTRPDRRLGKLEHCYHSVDSFLLGLRAFPEFESLVDAMELRRQRSILKRVCELAKETGVQPLFQLTMPKLPANRDPRIRSIYPGFYNAAGQFDFTSPLYLDLLGAQLEELFSDYPEMAGIEVWMAEGCGLTARLFDRADVESISEYLPGWLAVIDEVCRRHQKVVHFFVHQVVHTVKTREKLLGILAKYPHFVLMDDITWPEEHCWQPPLGHLRGRMLETFKEHHRTKLNFLVDAEYQGQGVLPSVFARFYQRAISTAHAAGIDGVIARVNVWDCGQTFDNYNAANAYIVGRLSWNSEADPSLVLGDWIALRFGRPAREGLLPVFESCEALVAAAMNINGIGIYDHSAFPGYPFMKPEWGPGGRMLKKTLSQLFQPAGTPLFRDDHKAVSNLEEWPLQMKIHAVPIEELLATRDEGIALAKKCMDQITQSKGEIRAADREMLMRDFEIFAVLCAAMKIYLRIGWFDHHGRNAERDAAVEEMAKMAADILSDQGFEYYFRLADRLLMTVEKFQNESWQHKQ